MNLPGERGNASLKGLRLLGLTQNLWLIPFGIDAVVFASPQPFAGDLSLFGPLSDWGNGEEPGTPNLAEGFGPMQVWV